MQYIDTYLSPLGGITLASNGDCLTGLWFDGQKYFADTLPPGHEKKTVPVLELTKAWLDGYFRGEKPGFMPPLYLDSTPFRLKVWEILQRIPYGQTITYKAIAEEIARQAGIKGMSAQAVGGAVGHNPISIVIPCHRVVGCNGSLTGYAGGVTKKAALLALERAGTTGLFASLQGTGL